MAAVLVAGVVIAQAEPAGDNARKADPGGVLRKPIPDKLVVLTFDDGCASGFTVVAPILKSLGFNGTFYVCDFDSFKTRKDWYMTWRQMKELAEAGFEIGNHTVGHYGTYSGFMAMEDELYANNGPKMTTVCWPLYGVDWNICPKLAADGYTFGRGGHERPYRPTVDNPFDVPSFTIRDGPPVESFIKQAQQACQGRVVVYCFHGVPDMEHSAVGLKPETFKVMMQYLKNNNYKVIAMRDLAEYIDPAKAAKLPPTPREVKAEDPFLTNKNDKPYVALAAKKIRPVVVNKAAASDDKVILTFSLPGSISAGISGTRIGVYVPAGTYVKALAPTFTISPFATAVPASGTARDFTKPQTYTITAQDGSTRTYIVTVSKIDTGTSFTWSKAEPGKWSDGSKWSNGLVASAAPLAAGKAVYILSFNMTGTYAVNQDLKDGFLLNQLNLNAGQGKGLTLAGGLMALAANKVTGSLPSINQYALFSSDNISAPLNLKSDLAVNLVPAGRLVISGVISGVGGLIYTGGNGNASRDLNGGPNQHYSTLSLNNPSNTYSGGTVVHGGTLRVVANTSLGTGPLTLNPGAGFAPGPGNAANPLILNGGTIDAGGVDWNAPITLNGNTRIAGHHVNLNNISGAMSGPGGFTLIGTWAAFGRANEGGIYLWGSNTYTGATIVHQGTLFVKKAVSLYNADTAQWTPERISINPAATLVISTGGPGEFTGEHVGTLLKNLTTSVQDNGLMAGSVFVMDTANATDTVTISNDIADSSGPGGGAFVIKKCGIGPLQLSGNNTYTGQTILEGGALKVSSINSFTKGKRMAGSSLGAPKDVEAGEIVIGNAGKDGEFALIYTGTGETSDRVINLAGKKSTVTFDQSGSGLLKLTSTFVLSGYGANKTIALKGDTAGTGEIAGNIVNPYDRAGKATTAVTKSGSGTWVLSGVNSYTGPTTVTKGTLSLANERSLGQDTDVAIGAGAALELNFKGQMRVGKLSLDGKQQPAGTYSAANSPAFIKGTGVLIAR